MKKKRVLVLCTGNSCRSQMAEGYLRYFAGEQMEVFSAGIEKHGVNPKAITFMQEDGVDISSHTSNLIDEFLFMPFDYVITICDNAHENCPFFPGDVIRIHSNFPDPAKVKGSEEQIAFAFRRVRDEIKEFSRNFVDQHIKQKGA